MVQELGGVNLALAKSKIDQLPIRVTRGFTHKHELSPASGYKYYGLYYVEDYWYELGKSGFIVWRYKLIAQENYSPLKKLVSESSTDYETTTKRKLFSTNRIVRDYLLAKTVKIWHKYQCQVCNLAIQTSAGLYAEAAHIQPLGSPHNGPDIDGNLLCLCPNHHVMFDNGGFSIADDLSLIGIPGTLRITGKHNVDTKFIKYHREHYKK